MLGKQGKQANEPTGKGARKVFGLTKLRQTGCLQTSSADCRFWPRFLLRVI